jgi:hypothetical protein
VRRWKPLAPYEPPRAERRERKCQKLPPVILPIRAVYKRNVTSEMWRKHTGRTALPLRCIVWVAVVAKSAFEILIHPGSLSRINCKALAPPSGRASLAWNIAKAALCITGVSTRIGRRVNVKGACRDANPRPCPALPLSIQPHCSTLPTTEASVVGI